MCRQIYVGAYQIKMKFPQVLKLQAPLKMLFQKEAEKKLKYLLPRAPLFQTKPTTRELPPQTKAPPTQTAWFLDVSHHATYSVLLFRLPSCSSSFSVSY